MTPFLRKLLVLNWLLLVVMLALAVFGVVAIYSATYMREDPVASDFWRKQANWVAVGFFAFMVASLVNYHWIRWGALPMYLAGIFFLVLTKFMGQKVYGARSWLHLGPINFQPAQLAVVAGIMVLGFLPATAVHNDYIFSAIGEQWGFVGGVFLISAFALLLLTCLFVAFFAGDQFGLLLVIGITALIFTHIFQNVGMTISILPITGVPLPLISYSGSFALMIMFSLGVVNSVE